MMSRFRSWHRLQGQDGYAFVVVLAFIALALPITVGTLQLTSQLTINSQLHQERLAGAYSS